uniref:Chromo domain-containing protein n=1 Tax=Spongospora subterranea TaxID=70186 RepID=A0A0H5RGK8_9EUKA|eukprot:CRZ07799.1 hypothetical protein [Spongospora subterranea]
MSPPSSLQRVTTRSGFGVTSTVFFRSSMATCEATSLASDAFYVVAGFPPGLVVETLSDYIFLFKTLVTESISENHAYRLRLYADSTRQIIQESRLQVAHDGAGFEIESIRESRLNECKWQLLVKWRGVKRFCTRGNLSCVCVKVVVTRNNFL